jgi:hypothetical protein
MNQNSFLRFSAIAALGLSAYLLQFVPGLDSIPPSSAIHSEERHVAPSGAQSFLAGIADRVTDWFAPAAFATRDGDKTLVLAEPVQIIRGPAYDGTQLPKGTAVQLLAAEGNFLRVRYNQSVITIPRSAVFLGAYRIN